MTRTHDTLRASHPPPCPRCGSTAHVVPLEVARQDGTPQMHDPRPPGWRCLRCGINFG